MHTACFFENTAVSHKPRRRYDPEQQRCHVQRRDDITSPEDNSVIL